MEQKTDALGRTFWILFALGIAWPIYRLFAAEAWILDDELSHFLISRHVWNDFEGLLDLWSRPGRNLLHFGPAYFGIEAARLWTVALAALAVWLTALEAKRLRLPNVEYLPLFLCFQAWFPELSFPVLTQTPFMVVWIAGVFLAMRERWALSAICWGYLSLVRHEGIALSGLFGLWVFFGRQGLGRVLLQGRWRSIGRAASFTAWVGFWTFFPIIVMNLCTWFIRKEIPFLIYFESKPTEMYGSGSLFHFVPLILVGIGIPVALLAGLGCLPVRWMGWKNLLYVTYPAYFVLHSVIFWRGMFASGGYYHFLMPMAPFIALLALRGFASIKRWVDQRDAGSWQWIPRTVLLVVLWFGLLLPQQQLMIRDLHIAGMPPQDRQLRPIAPPLQLSRFEGGLREASGRLEEILGAEQSWVSFHVAVSYYMAKSKVGVRLEPWDCRENPNAVPQGTLLVWEPHYAPSESFNWGEDRLTDENWELLENFAHGTVRLYRKR